MFCQRLQAVVLLLLMLSSCGGCESLVNILRVLHDGWNIKELTLVYHTYPILQQWSYVVSPRVSLNLSRTGINVTYVDLRYADLRDHVAKIKPKPIMTMLALPASRLKSIFTQILEPETGKLTEMRDRWQVLVPVANRSGIEVFLKGTYVPVTCQLFFLVLPPSWGWDVAPEILEAFHHGIFRYKNTSLPLTVAQVPRGVTIPYNTKQLWMRRSNLGGVTLKAGYVVSDLNPWVIFKEFPQIKLSGHFGEIWEELQTIMNFSFRYQNSVDSKFGRLHPNGEWSGLIGMLHRREIDVALAGLSITNDRAKVVDFTHIVCTLRYFVYFKKNARKLSLASVLSMAPWQIFVVLLTSVALSTVAQLVALWLSPEPEDWKLARSPGLVAFNNLYAFCMQGTEWGNSTLSTPARLVQWLTYFCGFVVFNMYSATMMSRLAVSSRALPFSNIEELVRSNMFKLIAVNETADMDIIKSVLQNTGDISDPNEIDLKIMPADVKEGIERVCDGNFALVTSVAITYTDAANAPLYRCNPVAISTTFKDSLSFPVMKGSPYLDLFNMNLQMMVEQGILRRSWEKWDRKQAVPEEDQESLGMPHTIPLFLWISIGIVVSLCTVLIERCVFKLTHAERIKKVLRIVLRNMQRTA